MDVLTRHRLRLLDLDAEAVDVLPVRGRIRAVYHRFVQAIPFENFSALARRRERPAHPAAWPRSTDRLLEEAHTHGLGGTCFSMAYALADLLRGVGANAHTALGHNLQQEEPHAAVVVYEDEGPVLYDPSFFVGDGIPIWPGASLDDGLFRYDLDARCGPMLALVRTDRDGVRSPLFSLIPMPAPPDEFRRLWIDAVRRRPDRPGRICRRVADELRWFGEEVSRVDVVTPTGRRSVPIDGDPIAALHRLFGVSEDALRSHFASAAPAP